MKDRITIEGRDGAFGAYVAWPKALPAPSVVVLQELFGVNADIRKTCNELAEQGFVAVAPDLFWRQEPGVDLNVTSDADWQHGLRLYQAYDRDAGVRDVKDTLDAAPKLPDCTGKVAVLGYCLGALMTFLTAVRSRGIDAAVAYHGGDTEKYLGEVDGLSTPLLMHLKPRRMSSFPRLRKLKSKRPLPTNQTRRSTAIRVRITRSLGMVGALQR
jgi:carboxymethylenebutenolidase